MAWKKPKAAAEHYDVSLRTIFSWLGQGLPSVKVGRNRLIDISAGDEWLRENFTRKTQTEQMVDELLKGL